MLMRKKYFLKDLFVIIPLIISGLLSITLVYLLWQKTQNTPEFISTLEDVSNVFVSIAGFLAAIIMVYLALHAASLKNTKHMVVDALSSVTQKMHDFRSIVEILMHSKMWLPGLQEYIDDEFAGLNFFDVKEFYKGKSKLAIEFLQESHQYGDTENLYLEMKSLLMTSQRDKKIPEAIVFPTIYDKSIVGKWLEHKCSSGLWYYFGYKFAIYKDSLDIESVFDRHQEKIMTLAHSIDSEAFEDSSFNEVFISKLGEYMSKEVLPKLYEFQGSVGQKLPAIVRYLYIIFLVLVLFGLLLPIASLLFSFSSIALIISYSLVISTIFFIATTFYQFLNKEMNS